MNMKQKILSGYGVIFFLLSLVIGWAIFNFVTLGQASDAILRENYRSIIAAENMIDSIERQDSAILFALSFDSNEGIRQFREHEAVFLQWLSRARDNITLPGEQELVRQIEEHYRSYRELLPLSSGTFSPGAAAELYQTSIYPAFSAVRTTCVELRALNESAMYRASTRASAESRGAIWSTAVAATLAIVFAFIFSLILSGRITRPLNQLMDATRRIAAGDYTVALSPGASDEFGVLTGEFNRMAGKLHEYHQLNISRIIAEQQKGEAILSSIEDGLVVFGPDLTISDANPAAIQIFASDLKGDYRSCIPDKGLQELIRLTATDDPPPRIAEDERFMTLTRNDRVLHFHFSLTTIRGDQGEIAGVVLLLRDVTRLREVERLKSEFIMAASHELRTPLTSIAMSIDLLLEHNADQRAEKDSDLLQTAHEEVNRLRALINDLLDLSRLESGQVGLERELLSIGVLFERACEVFAVQLQQKSVDLSAEIPDDLPPAPIDGNKITWVLSNLISNGLRYVPAGGHIHLSARHTGGFLQISVRDDGPGIPTEYQSRIFQKFVQVKGNHAEGTGLGLAICKEIVRAHGGTIWVDSEEGRGSTFCFTLPLEKHG